MSCTCLVWVDGLGNPDGRVTRDPECPVHSQNASPMSERPLNEYIDLEAYDVVAGEAHRELVRKLEDEIRRRDVVLDWLAENTPEALELCPYKLTVQ